MKKPFNLKIGELKDWKFGLITREIERVDKDKFLIHDISDGWNIATVNKKTIEGLVAGKISLLNINFE